MDYLCDNCHAIISEEELASENESRGEFWGFPAYETISVCPYCHCSDLTELTVTCSACNEYITDDYIETDDEHHYCSDCIKHITNDPAEFTCSCCKETFSDDRYETSDSFVYCPDCITKRSV